MLWFLSGYCGGGNDAFFVPILYIGPDAIRLDSFFHLTSKNFSLTHKQDTDK